MTSLAYPSNPSEFADDAMLRPSPRRLGIRVTVRGDVDVSTAPRLAIRLRHALELPVSRLRVDLAGVGFMDAHGLAVLCDARLAASDRRVAFVLESPPQSVQQLILLTGIAGVFDVYDDGPRPSR